MGPAEKHEVLQEDSDEEEHHSTCGWPVISCDCERGGTNGPEEDEDALIVEDWTPYSATHDEIDYEESNCLLS